MAAISNLSIRGVMSFREFRNLHTREIEHIITEMGGTRIKGSGVTKKGSHQAYELDGKKFTFAPHAGRALSIGSAHAIYKVLSKDTIARDSLPHPIAAALPPAAVAGAAGVPAASPVAAIKAGEGKNEASQTVDAEPQVEVVESEQLEEVEGTVEEVPQDEPVYAEASVSQKSAKRKKRIRKQKALVAEAPVQRIQLRSIDHFQEILNNEYTELALLAEKRIYTCVIGLMEQGVGDLAFLFQAGTHIFKNLDGEVAAVPQRLDRLYGAQLKELFTKWHNQGGGPEILVALMQSMYTVALMPVEERLERFYQGIVMELKQKVPKGSSAAALSSTSEGSVLASSSFSSSSSAATLRDGRSHDASLTTDAATSIATSGSSTFAS